jgi:rfaE bifunctional protein kinase chain/domain
MLFTSGATCLILQDYNKGVLTERVIQELMTAAKKQGIPTAVDPKLRNFWAYKGADLFKPNLKEVREALNLPVEHSLASLKSASALLREKLHNRLMLITLSEHGTFADDGTTSQLWPTQPRIVADVCGAGDTVVSIAAMALAAGCSMPEIATLANLAGGQVVERAGVVPVDRHQLLAEAAQVFQQRFSKF